MWLYMVSGVFTVHLKYDELLLELSFIQLLEKMETITVLIRNFVCEDV